MRAAVLHLPSIDLELDFVGRFGAGKNDPAHDKRFGRERDRESPCRPVPADRFWIPFGSLRNPGFRAISWVGRDCPPFEEYVVQELPTHCVIVVESAGTGLFSLPLLRVERV